MSEATTPLLRGKALKDAAVVCVLVHGRGQSPAIMEESVVLRLAARDVAYVLPKAATGSWYDAKAVDALTDHTRNQLAASLNLLKRDIDMLGANVPVLLAGFSQGACLALEYAFRFGPWNGALVGFTGCRVGGREDEQPHSDLAGMPVYLTGADADPWIPLSAFGAASVELGASRARLRTDVFPGRPHEVSAAEIAILDNALVNLGSGREVFA